MKVDSIVFDLDKTLIYTFTSSTREMYRSGILEDPRFFAAAGRIYHFDLPNNPSKEADSLSSMWGSMRPGARDFLRFCFQRFKRVIVFTAGTAEYAVAISKVLFQGIGRPYLIWSRGHCIQVAERAVDVDRRLVELGYYDSRAVQDESEEMEYMNAKDLNRLAKLVGVMENDDTLSKDQFMIVEDNYHSFITRDPLNAFFLSPYQSSHRAEISNIPGTPGYSPDRLQAPVSNPSSENDEDDEAEDEDEDEGPQSLSISSTPREKRKRKTAAYNWMLYPEDTLEKLKNFISQNPDYTAEQYTRGWNSIYTA
jgi:hypothetical protein